MLGTLITIAGFIFYIVLVVVNAAQNTGGFSEHGTIGSINNYGLYDMPEDFSLNRDRVDENATKYLTKLKNYTLTHTPKNHLKNEYCELLLDYDYKNRLFFYCKERTNGKTPGRYYCVCYNEEHVSTMWAIIEMEFNSKTTYDQTKKLYQSINRDKSYFVEMNPKKKSFLHPYKYNKYSQNEFCKMEYINSNEGDYIVLSEVWGNKPKKIIKSHLPNIIELLDWLLKDENVMKSYDKILSELNKNPDYIIENYKEINTKEYPKEIPQNAPQISVEQKESELKEPEPIRYIHVDFNDTNNNSTDKNLHDTNNADEFQKNDENDNYSTQRYSERKIDL